MTDSNSAANAPTGGVVANEKNPVPPLPNHSAAHTILSQLEDALLVEGMVITAELAAWAREKLIEAKAHL